ncbi:MAG: hypothetical protein Q7U23_05805 [Methylococcales bacterium]|nr:hypothetical protein [Methylococcales bacterium]
MTELKIPTLRTIAALFFVALSYSAQARTVMTITCNEPNGTRTDFYQGKFQEEQDGFAGVTPKFIFDDTKPQLATALYQPAAAAKEMGFRESVVFKIIVQTTEQITMVATPNDKNVVQMYSIFPKQGIGYFSIHRYMAVKDGEASTATLLAKCNIVKN